LVALTVFGIASTALVATLLLNVRSNRISKEISEATTLARPRSAMHETAL
jgi:type II secretory pathway pseudopilin PulG